MMRIRLFYAAYFVAVAVAGLCELLPLALALSAARLAGAPAAASARVPEGSG